MSNAMEDYRLGCLSERIEEREKRDRELTCSLKGKTCFEEYLNNVQWRSKQAEEDYE